jgi:hypothetical protein
MHADLNMAIGDYQGGRLEQAAPIYESRPGVRSARPG